MSQHIKNVVLVHGAFADGSGWKKVADILKNDGYTVSVALVLVGHSYFLRVRHVGHMARLHFDRLGLGALRHHALLVRVNRSVLSQAH